MARIWVLETQTKGTGANMVPLERTLNKPGSDPVEGFRLPKRRRRAQPDPAPQQPRRFKVIDVVTREVLAEDVDARTTVGVLEDTRSLVDVTVHVWEPGTERWRMLSFEETRHLWDLRGRVA